jgi:hypothetical protein
LNSKISYLIEVINKGSWTLLLLFVFYFSLFYFIGDYATVFASKWMWSESYEQTYPNATNLQLLYDLLKMLLNGNILKLYTTIWSLSPILFTACCTLSMVSLNYAMMIKKKQGQKHIAAYILEIYIVVMVIYLLYYYFVK